MGVVHVSVNTLLLLALQPVRWQQLRTHNELHSLPPYLLMMELMPSHLPALLHALMPLRDWRRQGAPVVAHM